MDWHTAMRTSHQVHHDVIIETSFSTASRLQKMIWHVQAGDVTVAKLQ